MEAAGGQIRGAFWLKGWYICRRTDGDACGTGRKREPVLERD